ncbi:calcium-binding protein [Enterovibrio paralichthyis]|uniref:calcium-binding protein n=1 Tax=Enterovibrio paralichthyis TaxID=2853805 RepID=UPI001C47754D|nr:calcium-binding protein [Enterovibrio paralichthyis]MBV7296735.1 calcium-binding protein [Enterovibrio paralichthyis]
MNTVNGIQFDSIKYGSDLDENLAGTNGDDFINGMDGKDTIVAFGGDDLILGDDIPLSDYLDVSNEVFLDTASTLYESLKARDLTWLTSEDIQLAAFNIQQFVINNPSFFNEIATIGDNDFIVGGSGADTIMGGAGDDFLGGGQGDDVLVGVAGNNDLLGGTGSDILIGGIGNDRLFGGDDSDYLVGTSGDDFYIGGAGQDYFVFTSLFEGVSSNDRIVDFVQELDKIVLFNVADNFEQLDIQQVGITVVLTVSETHTITFNNSNINDFSEQDFIFNNF